LYTINILDIEIAVLEISFIIHSISELTLAIKNNIFESIKIQITNNISFCFKDKNNQANETIKLYQIVVYDPSKLHPIKIGFNKANINENSNNVLDLYTREVVIANHVLNIKNKNVVQTSRILSSSLSQIKYLQESITK
jgi:hypothetical protein